ncbi:MAG: hypothetical protein MUE90_04030 [Thermoanaerobaculales bacterium]|jgi:diacylglycerol kinase family enzyme|nr:hypothetical protein [Thermoanaerobaculales bacterium]
MTRVPVILNPIAGGGRLLRHRGRLAAVAAACGAELAIETARSAEETTELAARAAAAGLPLVFAFGGDGTYNAVARGLIGSPTAMGVLPGGTTSVLAYELAVPRPSARAVAALLAGRDREMRVGRSDRGDLVLLMLSAGPDSWVLERLRPSLKRFGGRVGVALQGLVEALGSSSLPRLRVVVDGAVNEAGWVIVGKSRCYGGSWAATPGADPFRGDFEVVAQRTAGRRAALAFLAGIPGGSHLRRADVLRSVATQVRLEPGRADTPVPFQIDGDVIGHLPVELSVDPRPLRVRMPAGGAPQSSAKRSVEM